MVQNYRVTNSAFTQARKKLSHKAFVELNEQQTKYFYDNVDYKRWNSFRLVAVDGSTLIVPKNEETIKEFGQFTHSPKTTPVVMARASQAYDPLNKITIDTVISPLSVGELDLAASHIKKADVNDLYLFDRGYNAFWLFSMILSKGSNFCARINIRNWKAAHMLIESGLKEKVYIKYPSEKAISKSKELDLSVEPIVVRFISIDLDNSDKEVLATSLLDFEKYPYELFEDLYHNRWQIEESYKIMKSRVEMENFTGKSPEEIKQDFHARTFTQNLAAILAFPVHEEVKENNKDKKYEYQINWTQAIAKMKDSVVLLFIRDNIHKIIEKLQKHFLRNIEPVRPNLDKPEPKR
ncbi:MAG: IS4 family transposase [Bacteroidetes bacterium]|nr:IS4 family transposase [Bacteroidota bacterium]